MSSEIKVDTISENTSANGVVIDSVTLKDGGVTATAASTITTADNLDTLTLTSTDADATSGPILKLNRNSASPADSDDIGKILFTGENDASESIDYATIRGDLLDVTDGTEDGIIKYETIFAGTNREMMRMGNGEGVIINEDSIDMDFRVESNGNTHMLFVNGGDNRVGVGVGASPAATLDVEGTVDSAPILEVHASSTSFPTEVSVFKCNRTTTDGSYKFLACNAVGVGDKFRVLDSGNAQNSNNSYGSTSDQRLKSNIKDANSQWDDIKAIKVRNFTKYDMPDLTQIGVVAQELEASGMNGLVTNVDPDQYDVKENSEFGTLYEDGDSIPEGKQIGDVKEVKEKVKTVSYSVLYMKAIKALQEAMAKIETLETKVKALEDA
jgi:hypothetical protein